MTRLEAATERLEKAISRLETAATTRCENGADDIMQALEQAKSENVRLRDATDDVSRRLDAAIGRLKRLLES